LVSFSAILGSFAIFDACPRSSGQAGMFFQRSFPIVFGGEAASTTDTEELDGYLAEAKPGVWMASNAHSALL